MKKRQGFYPVKKLGQHFLRDPDIVETIIRKSGLLPSDRVLEIGSGLGALTIPLARSVREIIAVEKDARLVDALRTRLLAAGIKNVTLVRGDILRFDFHDLPAPSPRKMWVMGNLPYNLSSPILGKLMDHRDRVGKAVLMFQAELGRRLLASPGSKTYGALTVMVRYFAQGRELIRVPREAFRPRPKVDSMVLELDFEQPHPRRAENEDHFRKIVKGAFAHRRKTLQNSLRGTFRSLTREPLTQAMNRCGVPLRCRAEDLSVDDFLCLSAALDPLP